MKLSKKTGSLILGFLPMLGGSIILYLTNLQKLSWHVGNKMGPGFFPIITGIGMLICGLLIMLEELHKKNPGEENEDRIRFDSEELKNLLAFLILGLFIIITAKKIGMIISIGIVVFLYIKFQGKESWIKTLIISIGMMIFLYFVFVVFLKVPLPKSLLKF
ncbi:MAG: tripartite tricarboxylate transporter TctB family protein [Stomatobaculum sp.]